MLHKLQSSLQESKYLFHVCLYSYEIFVEWLIDYITKHWKDVKEFDNSAKISAAIPLLRAHSGIKGLEYESGLRDPKAAIGIPTIPGHPDVEVFAARTIDSN